MRLRVERLEGLKGYSLLLPPQQRECLVPRSVSRVTYLAQDSWRNGSFRIWGIEPEMSEGNEVPKH